MIKWAIAVSLAFTAGGVNAAEPAKTDPGLAMLIGGKDFCVATSALSPFIVIRNDGPRTTLFQEIRVRSGPTRIALVDDHKVKVFPASQAIDPKEMSESWMVLWFNGGKGWEQCDIPILAVLQRLPSEIKPANGGIELVFPGESGIIALLPLYGSHAVKPEVTASWSNGLPDAVAAQCRMLAEISREYPIEVQEKFKLFPQQDKVLIRDRFEFLSIDDAWKTPHKKIAPLEYTVALAFKCQFRLLSITGKPLDLAVPTCYGPWMGMEGDECAYTFTAMLRYVNNVGENDKASTEMPRTELLERSAWCGETDPRAGLAIEQARFAWQTHDEDAYRLGCYSAAKQFCDLWCDGMARNKWELEYGLATTKLPAMRASLFPRTSPELRFMKDRMGINLPETAKLNTKLLWHGTDGPKPDAAYHTGVGGQVGATARSPVLFIATEAAPWPTFALGGQSPSNDPSGEISLGTIQPGNGLVSRASARHADFSIAVWAADYLAKPKPATLNSDPQPK